MKKLMTVLATALVALTLVGCTALGDAKTSGTKWTKTFKLDATGDLGKDADGKENKYSRGFAALSTSKKCSAIETEISLPICDKNGDKLNIFDGDSSKAVIGLAFDVHVTTDTKNNKFYDFVLIGIQESTGKYYVEHYSNVAEDKLKETMKTSMSDIDEDATVESLDGKGNPKDNFFVSGKAFNKYDAAKIKKATEDKDTEAALSWKISVTQDVPFTYVVKIDGVKVATYNRIPTEEETKYLANNPNKTKGLYGQVFLYGNAPKGSKINAKFKSNKEATVGLFADEEEF